jgi:hypothetical protein
MYEGILMFLAQDESGHFAGQDAPEMSQEFIEQQRTKIWSCYFLTKHTVHQMSDQIKPLFKAAESKAQDFYKKMLSEIFERCVVQVSVEDGTKVFYTTIISSLRSYKVSDLATSIPRSTLTSTTSTFKHMKMFKMLI